MAEDRSIVVIYNELEVKLNSLILVKKIDDFRKHTDDVHGIDYSKEAVMQFLLRKQGL